ncbi:MmyB family transcriptional regulator [Streptomyces sp. NPDC003393]
MTYIPPRAFPGRQRRRRSCAVLVRDLSAGSRRFAELWATGAVAAHRKDHKIVQHPAAGPISVDCDVLADGDTERKIVVLAVAAGTQDETRFERAVDPVLQGSHSA